MNLQNEILLEQMQAWLEEQGKTLNDVKKDSKGKYIEVLVPLYLPDKYQEL